MIDIIKIIKNTFGGESQRFFLGQPIGEGKPRNASNKEKSTDTKEYRRKKQDALEGKDSSKYETDESDSEGKGHHGAEKAETDEGGSHSSSQSLSSGATTVQFSSGGNLTTSLGSLLGLFASSSSLARGEAGSIIAIANQASELSLRTTLQASLNQIGTLFSEENPGIKGTLGVISEQNYESGTTNFNLDFGSTIGSHGVNALQSALTTLASSVSAQAAESANDQSDTLDTPIIINILPTIIPYYPGFNSNASFISAVFAFQNSSASIANSLPYNSVINNYFTLAGLGATGSYVYKVISPIVGSDTTSGNSGITINPVETTLNDPSTINATEFNITNEANPLSITSSGPGLTISAAGDIFADVAVPTSVLIQATNASGNPLIERIDAGPGGLVNQDNVPTTYSFSSDGSTILFPIGFYMPNTMLGLTDSNGQFSQQGTFFNSSGYDTIIGNGKAISVNQTGTVSYVIGASLNLNEDTASNTTNSFNINPTGSVYDYSFPTSTIFRHVGTSLNGEDPVPTEAAYGNFSSYTNPFTNVTTFSTITLPQASASDNLTFGGNVLDVYGTKYGAGDVLNVNLPSGTETGTSPANIINMGGNTLGGFGTSYGDLQTLSIFARNYSTHPSYGQEWGSAWI